MAFERAKRLGKNIIAYPEDQPSLISSKDWVRGLVKNPKDYVSWCPQRHPSSTLLEIGHQLCVATLSYLPLDHPLQ
jgi:hypothetical protein